MLSDELAIELARYSRCQDAADLPPIRLHDLWHHVASLTLSANVDIPGRAVKPLHRHEVQSLRDAQNPWSDRLPGVMLRVRRQGLAPGTRRLREA